jgi:hypothetical protein
MNSKTLEGVLHPDGRISLPQEELPDHPVLVRLTILEDQNEDRLSDPGDYLERLEDYEEQLLRGEIRWQ